MSKVTFLCIIGTRPEAIKMAPVIKALGREAWAQVKVVATAQHREMLDQVLSLFEIAPDIDLNLMKHDQSLAELTGRILNTLDSVLEQENPHVVLAQGDTTTVMATALACFYRRIPFGHIEAGLRTGDTYYPFPEEVNRVIAGRLSKWHFAPTLTAKDNLAREAIPEDTIYVTGNTVIDALLSVAKQDIEVGVELSNEKKLILVTAHRRENFGQPLLNICRAIRKLASDNEDVEFLYPVHPNPNVKKVVKQELDNHPRITLCAPLHYGPFVSAMKRSYLILTDSGGVQEEAPALGKPVLVLRNETERPEALSEGVVEIIGPNYEAIVAKTQTLLDDKVAYSKMAMGVSPYGDGKAAERIVGILKQALCSEKLPSKSSSAAAQR